MLSGYTEAELIVTATGNSRNTNPRVQRGASKSQENLTVLVLANSCTTFNPSFPNLFFISREAIRVSPGKLKFLVARGISSAG